jgi:hypothetical protein
LVGCQSSLRDHQNELQWVLSAYSAKSPGLLVIRRLMRDLVEEGTAEQMSVTLG